MLGDVMAAGLRDRIFIATKLETPDPAELKRSLSRLKTSQKYLKIFEISAA